MPAADVRKRTDAPAAEEPTKDDILADLEEELPGLDLEKPAEPEEPAKPPAEPDDLKSQRRRRCHRRSRGSKVQWWRVLVPRQNIHRAPGRHLTS